MKEKRQKVFIQALELDCQGQLPVGGIRYILQHDS